MAEKDGVNAMAQAPSVPLSGPKLDNRRVLAAIIDLVVVGAGWAVVMAAGGVLGEPVSDVGGGLLAVGLGWALYYYFACESGGGQTLGKRVVKIRVVALDGRPADMREVALRTVLRVIDGLFFYLVGLIVMIATGERRGRLGDLVGGTMIVTADAPAAAVAPTRLAEAPEAPVAPRVPIAESGPAFAQATPVVEVPAPAAEPELEEPVAEAEAAPKPQGEEPELEEPVAEAAPEPQADEPEADDAEAAPEVYDISDAEPLSEAEEAEETDAGEPDVASPSLVELASDVSAVTEDPEREVEEEDDDEPLAAEADEEEPTVTVKSVDTVSAIDLVMQDAEEEESSAEAPRS
jgi:uncharacterized RDD family membrane protein YckC